jgi:tRNA nucleotidyltransferase (CCA-adding enzyme)
VVFPEVAALFGVPQPEKWPPEIDTGLHLLLALRESARLGHSAETRFAVLVHDLGKGTTPRESWPRHPGHEERSVDLALALCERLAVPNRFRELAVAVARYHGVCHRAQELKAATILKLLEALSAFRQGDRVETFLDACEADARGRTGLAEQPYPQRELVRRAWDAARSVNGADLASAGLSGEALGEALRQARIAAIEAVRREFAAI